MKEEASRICDNYGLSHCVPCVRALYDRFKTRGTILFMDVRKVTLPNREYIHHDLYPSHSITRNGQHFGYELDDLVFGNITPGGLKRSKWLSTFSYRHKLYGPTTVTEDLITELTYEEFIKYGGSN